MKRWPYIFIIILLTVSCYGQEDGIREEIVLGWPDGLINSLPNQLMPKTALMVMDNYDVTAEGWLHRRKGMSVHYPDSRAGHPMWATIPYYSNLKKEMLILNVDFEANPFDTPYHWGLGTIVINLGVLRMGNDATQAFSSDLAGGYYYPQRRNSYPYSLNYASMNERLAIAATNSEMVLFDGAKAFPARPLGPGQPRAVVINGGGPLTGRMKYKYCYFEDGTNDTSNYSSPSWEVNVFQGYVYVWGFTPSVESGIDSILLYRSTDDGNYEFVGNLNNSDESYCLDSIDTDSTNTFVYPSGPDGHCVCHHDSTCGTRLMPPGAPTAAVDSCVTDGYGAGLNSSIATTCAKATYSIVYVDSAGRQTYMSPGACIAINENENFRQKVTLSNIPVPTSPMIVKKYLLKCVAENITFYVGSKSPNGNVFILDTLDVATTTYTDSIRYDTLIKRFPVFCQYPYDYISGDITVKDSTDLYWEWTETPESTCYDDSTIAFQPTDVVAHGSRFYAIGNWNNPNGLYYSEFGRMTTWPYDKFINLASGDGDWLVRLLVVGDNLMLLRQNSIYALSGFSFYQYSLTRLISGVGLSAPRGLAVGRNNVLLFHKSGIYQFSDIAGGPANALSAGIKNSIDSIGNKYQRVWGGVIGDEYWFSMPMVDSLNDKTYIYSTTPKPHWKSYDFGVDDAIRYDYDTNATDFSPNRYILSVDNDSLWRWDYSATDTLDGAAKITAVMQTKYFFEGPEREKVVYVDLIGSGSADSMLLWFYDDYNDRQIIDTMTVYPDFTVNERQRFVVNRMFTSFSLKIQDFGTGDYNLKGIVIGYLPWDTGRRRP